MSSFQCDGGSSSSLRANTAAQAKCNTCRAIFMSTERIREHYRGDWHIFNSKRRSSGLAPLTKEDFTKLAHKLKSNKTPNSAPASASYGASDGGSVISGTSRGSNRSGATTNTSFTMATNSTSKRLAKRAARASAALGVRPGRLDRPSKDDAREYLRHLPLSSLDDMDLNSLVSKLGIDQERAEKIVKMAIEEEKELTVDDSIVNEDSEEKEDEVGVGGQRGLETVKEIDGNARIETESEALSDDENNAEFEGSDQSDNDSDDEEYLPSGHDVSIFDNKTFDTTDACLAYMESTFGFFVPDREYLEDLDGLLIYLSEKVKLGHVCIYCQKRFSSGRACQAHMLSTSHCKVLYEEDVDLDEFEDFYDFSSQYENEPALAGEGGDEGDQGALVARTLEVNHLGELVLLDGRNVGTRAYARYYRQRYAPVDMRESTMARRREELHRLESRLGMLKLSPDQINGLTNAEVAAVMVKQRRTERKALVVAERKARKFENRIKRREFMSVKDKLRSSENTTAKIRDYHSILM